MLSDFWALTYDDPIIWQSFEDDPAPIDEHPQFEELGIRIRDLRKSFGDRQVLRGVSLDIEPGQFVSVVGRSGCGKSTLLRLIAGLETPDEGTIQTDADDKRGAAIRIMFQEPRLLPWASVIRNVDIGLAGTEMQGRHHLARQALASVGLADRAHEWPSALSGGQKQRVALARALINQPGLLLLDEPLGALDALTRIEMQLLLESMWLSRRFTAVLVTHEVAEAVVLSDRVLLLDSGRITEDIWIDLPRPRRRGDICWNVCCDASPAAA